MTVLTHPACPYRERVLASGIGEGDLVSCGARILANSFAVQVARAASTVTLAKALYRHASLFNHSCAPVAMWRHVDVDGNAAGAGGGGGGAIPDAGTGEGVEDVGPVSIGGTAVARARRGATLQVRAVARVAPGQPLNISYPLDLLLPTGIRRETLLQDYRFTCQCSRCLHPADSPAPHPVEQLLGVAADSGDATVRKLRVLADLVAAGRGERVVDLMRNLTPRDVATLVTHPYLALEYACLGLSASHGAIDFQVPRPPGLDDDGDTDDPSPAGAGSDGKTRSGLAALWQVYATLYPGLVQEYFPGTDDGPVTGDGSEPDAQSAAVTAATDSTPQAPSPTEPAPSLYMGQSGLPLAMVANMATIATLYASLSPQRDGPRYLEMARHLSSAVW
eukprot:TRINITY_DN327_c0_g1_i1.p1 TRINITY_DN327_c0_g1~~TRINITY_DN327_c0_g1_i1.p1  ORF type:complete len:392 (+),score=75.06 TRINITY_DN327_c0_g1_i1:799-1974(+)